MVRIANQARALWKLCLSFRKHDWELADYPIAFRTQEPDPASDYTAPRFKLPRHVASIVNWHLSGNGDSREEALESLRGTFDAVKLKRQQEGRQLPRPGTHVPIEFASHERVNAHPELADDFIHKVLELDEVWISDESSLWDFHTDETNDILCSRIKEIYGVEVSDIQSARLSEILERIAAEQKSA
jgi:hypothetical protein